MSHWKLSGTVLIFGLALGLSSVGAEEVRSTSASDLAWLAGCWDGEQGEECWVAPKGGSLIGINRGPEGRSFEFLRISEEDGGLIYWASPSGRCPATPFRMTEASSDRAVFSNPDHDFPQRIEYWLDSNDGLHARVSATVDGETRGFELAWTRKDWAAGDANAPRTE